jgi:hypothetical protein
MFLDFLMLARFVKVGVIILKDSMFGQFWQQANKLAKYYDNNDFESEFFFTIGIKGFLECKLMFSRQAKLYYKNTDSTHYLFQEKEVEPCEWISQSWGKFDKIEWSVLEFDSIFSKLPKDWNSAQSVFADDDTSKSYFTNGSHYFPDESQVRMGLPEGTFGMSFFSDILLCKKIKKNGLKRKI